MVSFSLRNEYFRRLLIYCNSANTGRSSQGDIYDGTSIELLFGEEKAFVPKEFISLLSRVILNIIINDPNIQTIDLNSIHTSPLRNKSNTSTILRLLTDNEFVVENMTENDILDFFEFGCSIGCSYFMTPLLDIYAEECKSDQNEKSTDLIKVIKRITNKILIQSHFNEEELSFHHTNNSEKDIKSLLSNSNISLDKDLSYVAQHFHEAIENEEFITWCLTETENSLITRSELLTEIVTRDDLYIESEDSFLSFILHLSESNHTYVHLFEHVYIEFCSSSCISDFLSFI